MGTLDPSGKNYEAQKAEAASYVRTQILSKMDAERKISTTGQLQAQYAPEYVVKGRAEDERLRELNKNIAQNLVYSLTGDSNQSTAGTQYLTATTKTPINKTKEGYIVTDANGNVQTYKFKADGKTLADPLGFTKSFIGVMKGNLPDINEDQVLKFVKDFLPKGAKINLTTEAKGYDVKKTPEKPLSLFVKHIDRVIPDTLESTDKGEVADILSKELAGTGMSIKASLFPNDKIYAVNGNGDESPLYDIKKDPKGSIKALKKWMKANTTAKKIGSVKDKDAYAEELLKAGIIGGGRVVEGAGELD